jgi:TolB-like protein/Tfp pilus assembly protein PilF
VTVAHWLAELRRRNVHRVVIAYLAIAWLLAQVAGFLAETFAWPAWILRALVVVLLLGLPAAVAIAWFFELTPAGLVREQDAPRGAALRVRPHRAFDVTLAVLIAIAIGYFAATHDWQGGQAARSTGDSPATLAVLPFRPTVASGRDEALEFGMADTLITRLSGLADVVVSPLSSVRRYVALEQDPIAAGRELGVESVLDGSVQKSGERLRVTARLLRVADGRQLWSERFDEKSTDIFVVQDSIADRVAAALALTLSPAEKRRLGRRATNDAVAYDLYLNGRYFWNRRGSPDDLRKAIGFYSRAVERDPQFALAYSGLADALAVQGVFGVRAPQDVYPKALAAADRALELDPDLAEAHATRGHLRLNFNYDWQRALDDYDEAIRHDPRYAMAHMWRGFRLIFVGHGDEGLSELQAARDLEPDSLPLAVNYARGLYWLRRYGDAEAELARVLEVEPKSALARAVLVSVHAELGRYEEGLALLSQGLADAPGSRGLRGVILAKAGRVGEARSELARLEELRKREYVSAYDLASINAALGDADAAFAWLDRAVVERSFLLTTLRVDPVMDGLRSDPRYVDFENKIRMPPR